MCVRNCLWYRAEVEAAHQADMQAEKSARARQIIAQGRQQLADGKFEVAQADFEKAMVLQDPEGINVSTELFALQAEAKQCRKASVCTHAICLTHHAFLVNRFLTKLICGRKECVVEAEMFTEMGRPRLVAQKMQEAMDWLSNGQDIMHTNPGLVNNYNVKLASANAAVTEMEASEAAEEEEHERIHQLEVANAAEAQLFEEMEQVRVTSKRDLDMAHSRRDCRNIASLCGMTLALDPEEKFKKRTELMAIQQRATKKAQAFKAADAAAALVDDGFLDDAIEVFEDALKLDPTNVTAHAIPTTAWYPGVALRDCLCAPGGDPRCERQRADKCQRGGGGGEEGRRGG